MRYMQWLIALVLLVTVTLVAGAPVEVGKAVPDFSLTDINGKTHRLSDYKGKIVVLEWTNPNCPFVQRVYREVMPEIQREYTQKGIVWLAVNSTNPEHRDFETPESLKKKYTEWKASLSALLLDPEGSVGRTFDAKTTPHMFVINKDGVLVYAGAIDDDPRGSKAEKTNYVRAALESILQGKPVSITSTKPYGCTVKYAEKQLSN